MDEHVLRGNAAIIKCHIPSFVAEFVEVDSWIEDETTDIYPSADYGTWCATFHVIFILLEYRANLSFLRHIRNPPNRRIMRKHTEKTNAWNAIGIIFYVCVIPLSKLYNSWDNRIFQFRGWFFDKFFLWFFFFRLSNIFHTLVKKKLHFLRIICSIRAMHFERSGNAELQCSVSY